MRVAVVDDDPSILAVITEVLRDAGFAVSSFSAAAPCIDAVCRGEVDFIFSDINMPQMNGVEMLRTIKEHHQDVEVVMMTADARLESAIEATRFGAVDYLEKPFADIDVVVALAHKVAQRVMQKRSERDIVKQHQDEASQGLRFAGTLEETPLQQVLQVVSNMGKDGVLTLDGPPEARIFLRNGNVLYVSAPPLEGEKALYRLLRIGKGGYRLGKFESPDTESMGRSVNNYVLEGMRRKDEFERLAAQLPRLDAPWEMATDCRATLSQVAPWLVGVLADVIRGNTAAAALESTTYFDLDILCGLHYLWQLGAIRPKGP